MALRSGCCQGRIYRSLTVFDSSGLTSNPMKVSLLSAYHCGIGAMVCMAPGYYQSTFKM